MPRIQYDKAELIADWKTGKFTERALAQKHRISPATAHKLVAGIDKDLPALVSKQDDPGCVYIVTADEFGPVYKIGLTNDVEKRISAMQTGCPYILYALRAYKVLNPVAVEEMLHAFFHKKRIRGEWFTLNADDLRYIDDAMLSVDEVLYGS